MTSLRSMITSLTKTAMVTIARSVPGCRQPSWHRWHGLPTMGWLRTERERESHEIMAGATNLIVTRSQVMLVRYTHNSTSAGHTIASIKTKLI